MSSLVLLVPLALLLGGAALAAFLWSLKSGQYDDLDGAAERVLLDDDDERDLKAAQTALPVPTSPQNNREK